MTLEAMRAISVWPLVAAAALAGLVQAADAPPAPPQTFRVDEGRNINSFVRTGLVSAHLLEEARSRVWSAIEGGSELRTSELWSWSFAEGCYRAEPFGLRNLHADESNAAQLWSTVFLALSPRRAFNRATDMRRFPSPCASM